MDWNEEEGGLATHLPHETLAASVRTFTANRGLLSSLQGRGDERRLKKKFVGGIFRKSKKKIVEIWGNYSMEATICSRAGS